MIRIHPKPRLKLSSSLSGSSSFSPSSSSTSCSGATTLPPLPFYSFQSPSLPFPSLPVSLLLSLRPSAFALFNLSTGKKKKVPPAFLALKGQKQTGAWPASNSLGSGYKQGEGGGEDGTGRGRQERKWKAERGGKNCCVGTFSEATSERSGCNRWSQLFHHNINESQEVGSMKQRQRGEARSGRCREKGRDGSAAEKVRSC